MTFVVKDTSRDNEREVSSKKEAQEKKNDMVSLGADPEDIVIEEATQNGAPDVKDVDAEVIKHTENSTEVIESVEDLEDAEVQAQQTENTVPDQKPSITQDPVNWMPAHFVDEIQGVPTVNRKGYCVLAEKYGVSVVAEPVTLASDTEFEYAEFRAVASKDGQEYSGFGSAHIDREDDATLLNELAETRAMKRAVSWATGMGITAIEELENSL